MLVQAVWVFEHCRSKEDCLFAESWVIIANNYFREDFMCGAASATPPIRKTVSSKLLGEKGILTHLRMT